MIKLVKTTNFVFLETLLQNAKKDADAELGVKAKFAEMVGNPSKYPLFNANGESLQFVYNTFNKYPSNPDNVISWYMYCIYLVYAYYMLYIFQI